MDEAAFVEAFDEYELSQAGLTKQDIREHFRRQEAIRAARDRFEAWARDNVQNPETTFKGQVKLRGAPAMLLREYYMTYVESGAWSSESFIGAVLSLGLAALKHVQRDAQAQQRALHSIAHLAPEHMGEILKRSVLAESLFHKKMEAANFKEMIRDLNDSNFYES